VINLKNKIWIILIILLTIGVGVFFYFNKNNQKEDNNYEASKTSTNKTNNINSTVEDNKVNNTNNTSTNAIEIPKNSTGSPIQKEEEIATFSTKIYSKDSSRQNNINITCSTLNDTIVSNGATFSFCNTVGQATSSKGYQEADIYDKYGNKIKGLGGGNCQVSTTLYNAVLAVPSLVVTERHEHSNKVPYIQSGKDAAVAYGSYDFKFRNDSGNDIKIKASTDGNSINIVLISLQ
jgi:vancomycin resistance protein YoaR